MAHASLDRVKELLRYDPETGHFTWLTKRRGSFKGSRAGWLDSDTKYRKISIDNVNHLEHRLAWLYMTGEWPSDQIDHKNTVRSDNWWSNLRIGSQTMNNGNLTLRSDNTSGFKGVSFHSPSGKWLAQLTHDGNHHHLGIYETVEMAARAYDKCAVEKFGDFARGNFI